MEYAEKLRCYNGIAAVQKDGKWGFVDKKDNVVIAFEYDELYEYHFDEVWFFSNRINISKEGKWGYINSKGRVVIPFIYDYAHAFENGYATVVKNDSEVVVNANGKVIFNNIKRYNQVSAIDRSFFMASTPQGHHWGIVDRTEFIIVHQIYPFEDVMYIGWIYTSSVKKSKELEGLKKWVYPRLEKLSVEKFESIVLDLLELHAKNKEL